MNVSVYRNGILYSQICEKSRKVNSSGSSSLPGPTQRSQNWLEKKSAVAGLTGQAPWNPPWPPGEIASEPDFPFQSRCCTEGSVSSPGAPWWHTAYLSIPLYNPVLPICQFLIYTQLSMALERPVPSGQRTLPGKLTAKHSSHFLISTWTLEHDLKCAYL